MHGRFQRGGVKGVSPFFAFQDIITSAMAVIIMIVMMLALNIGKASSGDPAERGLTHRLEELLDLLVQANGELRTAQEREAAARLDPALLQSQIDALKQDLASIRSASVSTEKVLSVAQENKGTTVVASELARSREEIKTAAKRLTEAEAATAASLAAMQQAEENAKARAADLAAEQAKKNELWVIPDKTQTSKEPVLALVTGGAIVLQRFDHDDKQELRGRDVVQRFRSALSSYSKNDQYFVFYFKPSGVGHFEGLTEEAKSAGFEIGYDGIGEEIVVNFHSPR